MIFFDGLMLSNAGYFEQDAGVLIETTRLLSGRTHVASKNVPYFSVDIVCVTEDESEIRQLETKIGTFGTLQINEDEYKYVFIKNLKYKEYYPGKFQYEVGFVQATEMLSSI